MNKKARIMTAALLGALLLCTSLVTSCGASGGTGGGETQSGGQSASGETQTTEAATETTSALSTIEKQDYSGYEFKIISTDQDNRQVDVIAEEENGATLNDLVYRRNQTVEEMFNITIKAESKDYGSINTLIQKDAQSGDCSYDLYMTNSTANTLATGGYLLPWNDMTSMDISQPWWDQAAISGMAVGGSSYLITGDISPTCLLTSECILFNRNLFDNQGITYPYEDAFAGSWTIDKMTAIAKGLTTDLNGDGTFVDTDDLFSFTLWCDAGTALFYGAGGYLSSKDSAGLPVLDYNVEKITNIYNKIYDLVVNGEANYSTDSGDVMRNHEMSFKVFNEGRAYFCDITFQKIETFLRDMENDFGVLPLPKYDENQEGYYTNVSGAGTMIVVPVSISEIERTGTVIDALAASSYDQISPGLYDVIAGTKNVRDAESAEMVQLIIRNRVYDPIRMYGIDGNNFADDLLKKKSPDVASYFAKIEEKAQASLDKLVTAFTENNK